MKTYLTALDDGSFMMVQYGSKINGLLVEYYDKDYNLTGTKIIGKELPVFGGFYATKDNYYVVTGENNTDEDNTKEVLFRTPRGFFLQDSSEPAIEISVTQAQAFYDTYGIRVETGW